MGRKEKDSKLCTTRTDRPGKVLSGNRENRNGCGEGSATLLSKAGVSNWLEVDLQELPAVALENRLMLPHCAAVYFALSKNNEVLYIGKSVDIAHRWISHHRWRNLDEIGNVRIAWMEVNNSSLLPELEWLLIEKFKPSLNKRNTLANDRLGTKKSFTLKNNNAFLVRFSDAEAEILEAFCKQENRSKTDVVREYVRSLKSQMQRSA